MPILRQTSDTGVPCSAWRRLKAACAGLYRGFYIGRSSVLPNTGHHHLAQQTQGRLSGGLGILFLGVSRAIAVVALELD